MRKIQTNPLVVSAWDSEARLLLWLATCVSIFSFLFYFKHNEILLYGDAIAHINIARRVFDSKTPGLLQLGTVWLPLPHLVMIPFLVSKGLWQRGAGGSIPSMMAYVMAVVGIFRLVRGIFSPGEEPDGTARIAAWSAAACFAANPNLIYMQSTAMGESLYLAFFVWAVVYFSEWERGSDAALWKCGLCLAAACLCRYDGWFLACALCLWVVLRALLLRNRPGKTRNSARAIVTFILIAAAAPALWLAYNGIVYRNPLEFANGPYSAKAIEKRTQTPGNPGHPGSNNPVLAAQYFVKAAEANVAQNEWLQRGWIVLLAAGIGVFAFRRHRVAAPARPAFGLLFLLIPLPFYALSVAYGGVPIFIPYWWPFTHYNVRYGLQLLPAFAIAVGILVQLLMRSGISNRLRVALLMSLFAFVAASYAGVWNATPLSLKEAQVNMRTRNQLQTQVSALLSELPSNATLLMYLGDHVGALEQAGIPLEHTINEGNHRMWKQPTDQDGLWERALADPPKYVDYAVAFEGDPVWQAVHGKLPELVELHVSGQPRTVLYRAR